MKKNVYLAGPWFTEAQSERERRLYNKLCELGFNVFSPRNSSNITNTVATAAQRHDTFESNISAIDSADIIFAICDGKKCSVVEPDQLGREYNAIDSGTMIECGYAYSRKRSGKDITIVYYTETLGNKPFNLMLAQSADIVITKFDDIDNLVNMINNNETNSYEGEIE